MGKEKSTFHNKIKSSRKTFLDGEEKKVKSKATKRGNNYKNDLECDLDSLECMRDTTKRIKSGGIDEKIELLKTELKTLLRSKTLDKNENLTVSTKDSMSKDLVNCNSFIPLKPVSLESEFKENYKHFKPLQGKKQSFNPTSSSTPCKLSILVTEVTSEIVEQKLPDERNVSEVDMSEKSVCQISEFKSSAFNTTPLSQEKVELLLYESFVMQIPKSNVDPEKMDSKLKKSKHKTDKEKFQKSKKQSENCNKKHTQPKLNKYCRLTRGGRKRQSINGNSSQSDIEIVDLDSTSCSSLKTKNDTTCLNLEMKDYDWNEPFDLSSTELEILEGSNTKETCENPELELNESVLSETSVSGFNNEIGKTPIRKGWECPVCFEPSKGQELVATQCGHVFCKKCLKSHFRKLGENCPSCRTNLNNKQLITLFNF